MAFCTYQSVSTILNTGAMQSFIGQKLAEKLPVTKQNRAPLIIRLPVSKILIATQAIQLDMFMDDFIYTWYYYILPIASPLILGSNFCISYCIQIYHKTEPHCKAQGTNIHSTLPMNLQMIHILCPLPSQPHSQYPINK